MFGVKPAPFCLLSPAGYRFDPDLQEYAKLVGGNRAVSGGGVTTRGLSISSYRSDVGELTSADIRICVVQMSICFRKSSVRYRSAWFSEHAFFDP